MIPCALRRAVPVAALLAAGMFATATSTAPIRVAIFTGVGTGTFWHTSSHTAAVQIASILAAPDTAGIGPDLVIHPDGILAARFGLVTGTGTPTLAQQQAFVEALDTTDVAVFAQNTVIGRIFADGPYREGLEAFFRSKGVVSLHASIDSYGAWPAWDSLNGARFQNHPSSDRYATVRLDTLSGKDGAWNFLNRGLADTTFLEEWFSFTTNASVIRATSGLKTTLNIDEASYTGGLGGARAMGEDHPMSWYRELPEGGRFFYTAVGHRANLYQGGAQPRFLRRQLYNAILWAAGYNEDGSRTVGLRGTEVAGTPSGAARVSQAGRVLRVEVLADGPHRIEMIGTDGRLVQSRRGEGRAAHAFSGLRPGAHLVTVTTPAGRHARRVMVP